MTERDTAAATAAYTAKQPFVSKDQLVSIAEHFPTPFHLYDEAGICDNINAIHEAFAWNPGPYQTSHRARLRTRLLECHRAHDCRGVGRHRA